MRLLLAVICALLPRAAALSPDPSGGAVINHLVHRGALTHSYHALRHGQSLANVEGIISSDPAVSTVQHGLSEVGKEQAREAGKAFATAAIFAEELAHAGIPLYNGGVVLEKRLRERFFGELNGGPDTRYQEVWDVDIQDPNHNEFGVESANAVLERTTKLITELDERLQSSSGDGNCWKCILVAHGDVLQIMQTGFLGHEDASRHRSLEHLETATIREL